MQNTINRLLPQTQCRECGYNGCEPYAAALAAGEAPINLCAPGGHTVMRDLAALLQTPPLEPAKIQTPVLAWIDEAVCIGCTACIRACPVDAIMGASKQMHTVLADECTGCGLCVAPCPVDCIYLHETDSPHLPRNRFLSPEEENEARFQAAAHAQQRYRLRDTRLQRLKEAKRAHHKAAPSAAANAADLIAQAMARAQAAQSQRATPANREQFRARNLQSERDKAAFRRAQRDLQYGSESEKQAALDWLKTHAKPQDGMP